MGTKMAEPRHLRPTVRKARKRDELNAVRSM